MLFDSTRNNLLSRNMPQPVATSTASLSTQHIRTTTTVTTTTSRRCRQRQMVPFQVGLSTMQTSTAVKATATAAIWRISQRIFINSVRQVMSDGIANNRARWKRFC